MTQARNKANTSTQLDENKLEIVDLYLNDHLKDDLPFAQIAIARQKWMWYCDEPGGFAMSFVGNLVKNNNQQVVNRTSVRIPVDVVNLGKDVVVEYVREDRCVHDPSSEKGGISGSEALGFLRKYAQVENGLSNLSLSVQKIQNLPPEQVELLSPLEQVKVVLGEISSHVPAIDQVFDAVELGL